MSGYCHICQAGETFDSVALAIYGDEAMGIRLMAANPGLCAKGIFTGGEVMRLPVVERKNEQEGAYTPAAAPWKE